MQQIRWPVSVSVSDFATRHDHNDVTVTLRDKYSEITLSFPIELSFGTLLLIVWWQTNVDIYALDLMLCFILCDVSDFP